MKEWMKWHPVERRKLALPTDSPRIDHMCVHVGERSEDKEI